MSKAIIIMEMMIIMATTTIPITTALVLDEDVEGEASLRAAFTGLVPASFIFVS